jgi:hypothetical protein
LAAVVFGDFAGFDTASADGDSFRFTLYNCADGLQIGEPSAGCFIVGMGDVISEVGFFAAYFTGF